MKKLIILFSFIMPLPHMVNGNAITIFGKLILSNMAVA